MKDIYNGNISKNIALQNAPEPGKEWINTKDTNRINKIKLELQKDDKYKNIKVINALKNGQVILEINYTISASDRGMLLLELEKKLKNNIDLSLTVWLNPVGDKSKLRNLRGIKIKEL